MNSCACAARAAASIASSDAFGTPYAMFARDGVVEEHRVLGDERDLRSERRERHVADVDAIDQDGAFA